MKKVLPFMIVALLIPSAALAKGPKPGKGPGGNHGKAKVLYVLKGKLSGYRRTTRRRARTARSRSTSAVRTGTAGL